MKPEYVYVASSWRNPIQVAVCASLKSAGIPFYDFKRPDVPWEHWSPGIDEGGFHWSEVGMPSYNRATNSDVPVEEYLKGLEHPKARHGFDRDFSAMMRASHCVLVLPSGRSAHLEAGWMIGQGKPTAVLLDDPVTPDLMYLMAAHIETSLFGLLGWLGVED